MGTSMRDSDVAALGSGAGPSAKKTPARLSSSKMADRVTRHTSTAYGAPVAASAHDRMRLTGSRSLVGGTEASAPARRRPLCATSGRSRKTKRSRIRGSRCGASSPTSCATGFTTWSESVPAGAGPVKWRRVASSPTSSTRSEASYLDSSSRRKDALASSGDTRPRRARAESASGPTSGEGGASPAQAPRDSASTMTATRGRCGMERRLPPRCRRGPVCASIRCCRPFQ